jgi:hypothetical protein
MPPQDPTPLGDAMTHRFPEQKIPEPKPGAQDDDSHDREPDIEDRPALPDHDRPPGRQRG